MERTEGEGRSSEEPWWAKAIRENGEALKVAGEVLKVAVADLKNHNQWMEKADGRIDVLEKKGIETQSHIAQSEERLTRLESKDRDLENSLAKSESKLSQVVSQNEEFKIKLDDFEVKSENGFGDVVGGIGRLKARVGALENRIADFEELDEKIEVVKAFNLEKVKDQFDKWKGDTDASLGKAAHDASERVREQNIKQDTLSLDFSKLQLSTQMDH